MIKEDEFGTIIGIVTEIDDDKKLNFIVNNNIKCQIGDIVGAKNGEIYFLAKISEIKIDFYLENTRQYFVSKAVDNSIQKIAESNSQPRYGQHALAVILGCYELTDKAVFAELKNYINRFTPSIFQKIYLLNFDKTAEIYGLFHLSKIGKAINDTTIFLGKLSFPRITNSEINRPLYFNATSFKRHTLITGVTGSGKSRFSALLIKELTSLGAHISILDPHNEYINLLENGNGYEIYKFDSSNLIFNVRSINAITLTKLIPGLSEQQEVLIYEIFDTLNDQHKNFDHFLDTIIKELNIELMLDYPTRTTTLIELHTAAKTLYKNKLTEFIKIYLKSLRPITDLSRSNRSNVLMAVIQKVNELYEKGMLSNEIPNWIIKSSNSIDVFNIDYNTNSYVRRFINAIIQYFIRHKSEDDFRVLVIDEVHLLLNDSTQPSNQTLQLIKQLLREARKFNMSIIFISQNISDIPEDIRTQFQNLFSFRNSNYEVTKYFPDQVCDVTLYGSKCTFAMKVNDVQSISEASQN